MELQFIPWLELIADFRQEIRFRMQPGNFVLVLIGEQFEIVAGDRQCQRFGALHAMRLGCLYLNDKVLIAPCERPALISGEEVDAALNVTYESIRLLWFVDADVFVAARHLSDKRQVVRGPPAPGKGLLVRFDRHTIQLNGLEERLARDRHEALLPGAAEHEHVAGDRVTQQFGCKLGRFEKIRPVAADDFCDGLVQFVAWKRHIGIAGEIACDRLVTVHDGTGRAGRDFGKRVETGRGDDIAAQHHIGAARRDPHRVQIFRTICDPDMGEHGTALLRQANHVQHRTALAFDMGRHGDNGADRHHAGPADAGDQHSKRFRRAGEDRFRQGLKNIGNRDFLARRLGLLQVCAMDGYETGAEAVYTRVILVAARLVDGSLAAEFRFLRHDREAIRFNRAITAPFANQIVDHHALEGVRKGAAPAAAAFLRGAGLVVDEHGHAFFGAQLLLHLHQIVAVENLGAFGESRIAWILVRLVGYNDDPRGTFRHHLLRDARHGQRPVVGLSAGHRDGVVEQNLIGHVHAGGDGLPDRHQAGVIVGAVADIGEDMLFVGKGRDADPGNSLRPHMGEGCGVSLHPLRHEMAADSRQSPAAVRHLGRGVVRTAGTEIRRPLEPFGIALQGLFLGFKIFDPVVELTAGMELGQPLGDHASDLRGRQLADRRQNPFARLVEFSDHPRPPVRAPIVELFLQLIFDQRALLLDDQHFFQAFAELANALALERPGHAHLVNRQTDGAGVILVNAQFFERLAHVQIGLAAGHDAETPVGAVQHGLVQFVGTRERQDRVDLVAVKPFLHFQRSVRIADAQSPFRHCEIVGPANIDPVRIDIDRGRTVDRLGDQFERRPAPGIARHRPAVEAEIEKFLDTCGIQDRDHRVHERIFRLMRGCRRFAGMVVARQQEDTARRRRAEQITVPQNIAGTVDAGALRVPHGKDAVVIGADRHVQLLRAQDGGRREIFVDARLETDVVLFEKGLGLPELLVDQAERRSAVTGYEAAGIQPRGFVAAALHHRQADQGLRTRQEDSA